MSIILKTDTDYENMMLTCCHEAGHAVLATLSQFHIVSTDIQINRTKLASTGIWTDAEKIKAANQRYSPARLARAVAFDYAVIMYAGRFAEERLAKIPKKADGKIQVRSQGWQGDNIEARLALMENGIGKIGQFRARIRAWWLVSKHWKQINMVTEEIIRQDNYVLNAERIRQLLQSPHVKSEAKY